MEEENKKEIKKGLLAGTGTAAGAVIGTIVENALAATKSEIKPIPEVEVVHAIMEDFHDVQEDEAAVIESVKDDINKEVIASSSAGHRRVNETTHIKPDSAPHEASAEEDAAVVVGETHEVMEGEVLHAETTSEATIVDEDLNDDIMVVSVDMSGTDGLEVGINDDNSEITVSDEDFSYIGEAPDYTGIKEGETEIGVSMASAIDMPDYVNDANIDSFTDNV